MTERPPMSAYQRNLAEAYKRVFGPSPDVQMIFDDLVALGRTIQDPAVRAGFHDCLSILLSKAGALRRERARSAG